MTGGHWIVAIVLMALFWAAVAAIVIVLVRTREHPRRDGAEVSKPTPPAANSAELILHDRFARGEIDEDEYVQLTVA